MIQNVLYSTFKKQNKIYLDREERELHKPFRNEILIKHDTIGLNSYDFDISHGVIKMPAGFVPGIEATGVIEDLGSEVSRDFFIGERVAYCTVKESGAYSHFNTVNEDFVVPIPDDIQSHDISGFLLQGIIAHMLFFRVFKVDTSTNILLFNPTSSFGHIVSQLARHFGIRIIGVINDYFHNKDKLAEKIRLAEMHGCAIVLTDKDSDLNEKILDFTNGRGVQVVYDTFGNNNLDLIIDVMQYCSLYVVLGRESGHDLKISKENLAKKSIFVTAPSVFDYKSNVDELRLTAANVFDAFRRGIIKPHLNKIYTFDQISQAQNEINHNHWSDFINIVRID
jgi:NADPH2:quinone reductase